MHEKPKTYLVTHCTVPYRTVLYYAILNYAILHCNILCHTTVYCIIQYYSRVYCTILYCTVLHCIALFSIFEVGYRILDSDYSLASSFSQCIVLLMTSVLTEY